MEPEIRALTVRPPWSWAISHGGKDVENRSKPVRYRGLLAIHAGSYARWDIAGDDDPLVQQAWREWTATLPPPNLARYRLNRDALHVVCGAVVAVATLAGCHDERTEEPRKSCSPWGHRDAYHWVLADVRPLAEPVPCRGALGLWRLPEDVGKEVRRQLGPLEAGAVESVQDSR